MDILIRVSNDTFFPKCAALFLAFDSSVWCLPFLLLTLPRLASLILALVSSEWVYPSKAFLDAAMAFGDGFLPFNLSLMRFLASSVKGACRALASLILARVSSDNVTPFRDGGGFFCGVSDALHEPHGLHCL